MRRKQLPRETPLKSVFELSKQLFFPSGKSKKGLLFLMQTVLCDSYQDEIDELDSSTIESYLNAQCLKTPKFYLKTKLSSYMDSIYDSSEDDFDLGTNFMFSTPDSLTDLEVSLDSWENVLHPLKRNKVERNLKDLSDSICLDTGGADLIKESLQERRNIVKQQDNEFQQSLKSDREKATGNIARKSENLIERMQGWKRMLKTEPSLQDECIVAVVNHITKGRIQRFFYSDEKCCVLYYWIGSIAPEPEFFTLCIDKPDNVLKADISIVAAERNVIMMNVTDDQPIFFSQLVAGAQNTHGYQEQLQVEPQRISDCSSTIQSEGSSHCSDELKIYCPVCGQIQNVSTIEVHASNCADRTYIEVYESDEHEDDERKEVVTNKDTVKSLKEDEVIPALKNVMKESIEISEDKALLLKIRKNHCFLDFCNSFGKLWIRSKIGSVFQIKFYGQSGIDLGGLRREFFTGKFYTFFPVCFPFF